MADLKNETEKPKQKNCDKPRKISDLKQNFGIEQRNGKPNQKNQNKPRNIYQFYNHFGIEQQSGNSKKEKL